MTFRDIPSPLDNGAPQQSPSRDTESRSRVGGGLAYSFNEPMVSFTTKLPINQFNAMQQHCFDVGATMAGFVRQAIAEKLRRER